MPRGGSISLHRLSEFLEQKTNRKHESDNHIQLYSYLFVVIYWSNFLKTFINNYNLFLCFFIYTFIFIYIYIFRLTVYKESSQIKCFLRL